MPIRRKLLRIKLKGAELVEVYVDIIGGFDILFDEDSNCHELCIIAKGYNPVICSGNFDECHSMLNRIHNLLGISEEIISLQ